MQFRNSDQGQIWARSGEVHVGSSARPTELKRLSRAIFEAMTHQIVLDYFPLLAKHSFCPAHPQVTILSSPPPFSVPGSYKVVAVNSGRVLSYWPYVLIGIAVLGLIYLWLGPR